MICGCPCWVTPTELTGILSRTGTEFCRAPLDGVTVQKTPLLAGCPVHWPGPPAMNGGGAPLLVGCPVHGPDMLDIVDMMGCEALEEIVVRAIVAVVVVVIVVLVAVVLLGNRCGIFSPWHTPAGCCDGNCCSVLRRFAGAPPPLLISAPSLDARSLSGWDMACDIRSVSVSAVTSDSDSAKTERSDKYPKETIYSITFIRNHESDRNALH